MCVGEPHYLHHLWPIWRALPEEMRGTVYVTPSARPRLAQALEDELQRLQITARRLRQGRPDGSVALVASYGDLTFARRAGCSRVIYAEHGAGQTYVGLEGRRGQSYIGGPDRELVAGALLPGPHQLAVHQRLHPDVPAWSVGCPKLDEWHADGRRPLPPPGERVVAISFHWACTVAPETQSAISHYEPALEELRDAFPGRVLAHAHPRLLKAASGIYRRHGLEPVADFSQVLDEADVYACDNSSTIYEFASTGRPVVVLNAPWFRRDVSHGLRFWEFADVGVQVDKPGELIPALLSDELDTPARQARRRAITRRLYQATDGLAAQRAADAVRKIATSAWEKQ